MFGQYFKTLFEQGPALATAKAEVLFGQLQAGTAKADAVDEGTQARANGDEGGLDPGGGREGPVSRLDPGGRTAAGPGQGVPAHGHRRCEAP